jgi:thiol peroxidase
MKRFCEAEGVENVEIASVFRSDFAETYGTLMVDGPLQGLSARVVFVVDGDHTIRYVEVVDDITHEPDYEAAMKAVESI